LVGVRVLVMSGWILVLEVETESAVLDFLGMGVLGVLDGRSVIIIDWGIDVISIGVTSLKIGFCFKLFIQTTKNVIESKTKIVFVREINILHLPFSRKAWAKG
jgi:hypothetical protein